MDTKKKINSVESLCQAIWSAEKKLQLIDLNTEDVYYWAAARMKIYYSLCQRFDILEDPSTRLKEESARDRLWSLLKYIFETLRNTRVSIARSDICIFEHPRHKDINGQKVDIYTYYLSTEQLKRRSATLLSTSYNNKFEKEHDERRLYVDWVYLISGLASKLPAILLSKRRSLNTIKRTAKSLQEQFQINHNFREILISSFIKFKVERFLFSLILRRVSPKKLYLVVAYDYAPLISAAKSLNIDSVELQHGTISEYHLGYSYPKSTGAPPYYPNEIYTWNKFWKNRIEYPIEKCKVKPYGFPYFDRIKQKYSPLEKTAGKVTVLSQGALTSSIAKCILYNIDLLKSYQLHYKLHPSEYNRWKYQPELLKLYNNHGVVFHTDCDLYELLATSEYHIGVFSTAIFEGIDLGSKPVIIDLPGCEYMRQLLSTGRAITLDSFLDSKNLD
ncbi:conserved hypothetical protein [Hahella chejuensis KCTC 2396]|uniref:Capsule polysaccharide biosynthesis protein n=1 Tax=Hahella chejuensis (strain KCTC 2396) TaxID=349521 RepID=Q2SBN0_HAHCH|nr:hypothetical protein [Hahella chejuensis]ABC31944.1 conserved hypothetical protein [Hahella chejuensis KCTC 2396]